MAHSSIPSRRVRQFLSVTARKKILSLNRLFSFLTRKLELVCLSRFPRWDSIPEMLREWAQQARNYEAMCWTLAGQMAVEEGEIRKALCERKLASE